MDSRILNFRIVKLKVLITFDRRTVDNFTVGIIFKTSSFYLLTYLNLWKSHSVWVVYEFFILIYLFMQ